MIVMLLLESPREGAAETKRHFGDAALAAEAVRGDATARRRVVERVLSPTRRVVGYIAGGRADADDVVQISILQVLGALGGFRGDCSLEFFATRIAVRTAMRELRRWRRHESAEEPSEAIASTGAGADDEADLRRVRERLARHLEKLSKERRVAVVLHHVEGYGIPEIAGLTGAPVNTVRDRLRIGRRQLRRRVLADPELRAWLETERGA